jgi:glycosyltransferase involved in cell wall biosynthesis
MKIGIVIATYFRPDGRSREYLIRALGSVTTQRHHDYQVYVIGDDYSNLAEFSEISKAFSDAKFINLPISIERGKYPFGDYRLFCAGGRTPSILGVQQALNDGLEYVCHLDHDDWWEPNHLEVINRVIEEKKPMFVCTLSTYYGTHLPNLPITNEVHEFYPVPEGIIGSSTCIKYSDTKLRVRDCFEEEGKAYPGDADLWRRLTEEMKAMNRKGYIATTVTCHHDEEGYSFK